jgi:hypothetical protein
MYADNHNRIKMIINNNQLANNKGLSDQIIIFFYSHSDHILLSDLTKHQISESISALYFNSHPLFFMGN